MRFDIRIKYIGDSRVYRLFSVNSMNLYLDFYKFLPLIHYPASNKTEEQFQRHTDIRNALLQATSYRDTQNGRLFSRRADVEYLSIDGYKVNSFIFMQFI